MTNDEARDKLDSIRERFEIELESLSEINHGLIAWFERGRKLKQQMLQVAETVHKYQAEFAQLAEQLIDQRDDADWWKQ